MAAGAFDAEPAVQSLDPIYETHETGSVPRFCASDAVVRDDDPDGAVRPFNGDRGLRSLRVLQHVCDRLGDEIVDRGFDWLGQSLVWDSGDLDRDRRRGG